MNDRQKKAIKISEVFFDVRISISDEEYYIKQMIQK